MADPLTLANRIGASREIDAAAKQWLINGFAAWWIEGSGDPARLVQRLRLPAGKRAPIAIRDHWLRIAAEELPAHERAAELKHAVDAFMARQWPAWCDATETPAAATALQRALFNAADAGARMRLTRRQFGNILSGK